MTIDAANSNEEPTDKRKSKGVQTAIERPQITITEEFDHGRIKRIVDPSELGITEAQIQVAQPEKSAETKKPPSLTDAWQAHPKRPIYPTIYEENFGGTQRRVVTIDELSARFK